MVNELDKILISYNQPEFEERFAQIRYSTLKSTYFENNDERIDQLRTIIAAVGEKGDKAVAQFTEKFDGVKISPRHFRIADKDLKKAHDEIDPKLLESISLSIANVRKYQTEIFIGSRTHPGIRYTPLQRVGVCVPGASAPLPSTVIMTVVPAQVAGVKEIAVVSPPRYNGSIHPVILAVCFELGVTEVYRIGGAHAVAALAGGTDTIKKVDKIVGPGNQWVQMAKKEVFGLVDIDSIAGPSEVLIVANDSANPAWVAADMLSQAEHAPGSAVVFTDSQPFAEKLLAELKQQVERLSRTEETKKCLAQFGGIVVFNDMTKVTEWANLFAAEHLQIQCGPQSRAVADQIKNAGAIFIGDYSPVAVGDYWAGPSHTLPTGMSAKFFSALSSNDFIKSTSIIEYTKEMLEKDADNIIRLAQTEGLDAHAKSVQIRCKLPETKFLPKQLS